jgi:hypothetical protein
MVPFTMNAAQRYVHDKLEQQRREKGYVRAIIVKARQLGISTYTAARFYHRASMDFGVNVFILSHEQASADALFGIVDRFQRLNPFSPHVAVSNVKELQFDQLDSSYVVATAGSKATGRSRTITLMHGSECSMWNNALDHFAASVQAVPLLSGTEVILESTSSGATGEFYKRYREAEAGIGDYQAIFLPWWLDSSYVREPEPGFELSSAAEEGNLSEAEYAEAYGLSLGQMARRRSKIHEIGNQITFRREYPSTSAEAWTRSSDHEPFIDEISVMRARGRETKGVGPLILGVDPASMGGDRFAVCARRGMRVEWVRKRNKIDHLEGAEWVRSLIDEYKPSRVCIDAGNIGAAIVTQLKSTGPQYAEIVRGVDFGGRSQTKTAKPNVPGPRNRRAEMWQRMRDWFLLDEGAAIPDEDDIQADLTAPKLRPLPSNDFLLESKETMRSRGERSPDLADAIALTFAFREYFKDFAKPKHERSIKDAPEMVSESNDTGYLDGFDSTVGPDAWMG